jgi:hypothetical protein
MHSKLVEIFSHYFERDILSKVDDDESYKLDLELRFITINFKFT